MNFKNIISIAITSTLLCIATGCDVDADVAVEATAKPIEPTAKPIECTAEDVNDVLLSIDAAYTDETATEYETCLDACVDEHNACVFSYATCRTRCDMDYHRSNQYDTTLLVYGHCFNIPVVAAAYTEWSTQASCALQENTCLLDADIGACDARLTQACAQERRECVAGAN